MIRTTKCTLYWREQLNKFYLKQTQPEKSRKLWSCCGCKWCFDIYIQMSFSCTTMSPAELYCNTTASNNSPEGEQRRMCVYACLSNVCGSVGVLLCDCAVQYCVLKGSHRLQESTYYILRRTGMLLTSVWTLWAGPWGNKVPIKRHAGQVQTETKSTPTQSEVLSMTFLKSWSMYVVFFLGQLGGRGHGQLRFWISFKVLSAFCTWCF